MATVGLLVVTTGPEMRWFDATASRLSRRFSVNKMRSWMGAHISHTAVSMVKTVVWRVIKKSRTQTMKRAIKMDVKSLEC